MYGCRVNVLSGLAVVLAAFKAFGLKQVLPAKSYAPAHTVKCCIVAFALLGVCLTVTGCGGGTGTGTAGKSAGASNSTASDKKPAATDAAAITDATKVLKATPDNAGTLGADITKLVTDKIAAEKAKAGDAGADSKVESDKAATDKALADRELIKKNSNRSDKLPVNFLLAEDILLEQTRDPFFNSNRAKAVPPKLDASKIDPASAAAKAAALAAKPLSTDVGPDLTPITLKGVITSKQGAMALLKSGTGQAQTVKKGDTTMLTGVPCRVVTIDHDQVTLENIMNHQKIYLWVPHIVGYRPDAATGGQAAAGTASTTAPVPFMKAIEQLKQQEEADNKIIKLPQKVTLPRLLNNSTVSSTSVGNSIQLSKPEKPQLTVEVKP
jgi:Tfp pilus assembly protein PilP